MTTGGRCAARQGELPGDRIWAAASQPRLTQITCGGSFDRSAGHYTDNVIVYAAAHSEA